MPHPKDRLYTYLFGRIDSSIAEGYFLESSWIAYAIIEDRLDSILSKVTKYKGRLISRKLEYLSRISNPFVRIEFPTGLINRIDTWTSRRNNLTHEMANARLSIQQITDRSKQVALEGEKLAHDVSSAVMRTKKFLKKKKGVS
jgi:hypothetical protein